MQTPRSTKPSTRTSRNLWPQSHHQLFKSPFTSAIVGAAVLQRRAGQSRVVWVVQTCNGRGGAVAWATRGRVGWQRRREEEEKVGVGARKNRNEGVLCNKCQWW